MKKIVLFFLLFAGTGNVLHAQFDLPDPTEMLFNNPKTSRSNVVFTFYLTGHTRVVLDMSYISQTAKLPDLDSMLAVAVKLLMPLQDSLRSDGIVRRVDIAMRNELPKIRIITHPELANTYTIKDNELMQLKVNQDTVRLIGFASSLISTTWIVDGVNTKGFLGSPFVLSIITDNIGDIVKIGPDQLKKCLETLRPKIQRYVKFNRYNVNTLNYRAHFNMSMGGRMVAPGNSNVLYSGEPQFGFSVAPTFGFSRGSFIAGFQVGVDYNLSRSLYNRTKLRLLSEIEMNFPRDVTTGKISMEQNRFIGLQLLQYNKPLSDKLELAANFSVSFLISKNSTLYEKNSFRFGLPILTSKRITIEPSVIFNGWFKNPAPTIRLLFNF
jgi:hypothetical protein